MAEYTLVNIDELPAGTADLPNKIMFGIGALLHTTTLDDIKRLILDGAITEIPPNKIKIVNVFPHPTFDSEWQTDQLLAVGNAINYSLTTYYGGEVTTVAGERIVFRLIQSSYYEVEPGLLIPNILWRYYSEVNGALSFTGIVSPSDDIVPNGLVRSEPENLIDLGDIGAVAIEVGFNADVSGPFAMDSNTYILATQDGDPKIWKWIGADGLYGNGGTAATDTDFLLLSQAPESGVDYLPTKTITTTPYTIKDEDLNRPLIFTSNNQVVNVITDLAAEATAAGLTLFDFKATFNGTGTHTVNYPDSQSQTFSQGALVYALCIDETGNTVWIVKEIGKEAGTGDMEKATYDPGNLEENVYTEYLMFAVSDEETPLETGDAKLTFRMPYGMTLTGIKASVNAAPTGANLIVIVKKSGTSILSTNLSIDAGEKTSTTAATPPVISDSDLTDDVEMSVDIDQIGSTIAGAGLKITLIGTRT